MTADDPRHLTAHEVATGRPPRCQDLSTPIDATTQLSRCGGPLGCGTPYETYDRWRRHAAVSGCRGEWQQGLAR